MNRLSPVVLSENLPPSSFVAAPDPGRVPGGSRDGFLSHPLDTTMVSLSVLTIRQLIGLLAETEDQVRVLHHPTDSESRSQRWLPRKVLREQRLVLDELHRRYGLSRDEYPTSRVPGSVQNVAHSQLIDCSDPVA